MSEQTDEAAGGRSPGEAFVLLGNETRVAILQALWEATMQARDDEKQRPVSFSELRERVGMRDSGQFNYHLRKLDGHFVRKEGDGYRLRFAGAAVVSAILAGAYDPGGLPEPVAIGDPCPHCDGGLVMDYADERAAIRCDDCGEQLSSASLPSGVFEGYDATEYPAVFDRWMATRMDTVVSGFCMACDGRTTARVHTDSLATFGTEYDAPHVRYRCERCGDMVLSSLHSALARHPAVVSFYYDHGVDLREERSWRFEWSDEEDVAVTSTDPLRVAVTFEYGGEELVVTADENVGVVGVERR